MDEQREPAPPRFSLQWLLVAVAIVALIVANIEVRSRSFPEIQPWTRQGRIVILRGRINDASWPPEAIQAAEKELAQLEAEERGE